MEPHILVVEDDTATRLSLVAVLEKAGYRVTSAVNGESALSLLIQTSAAPHSYDVVITDIQMGAVSGMDVMQAARNQDQYISIIILTGFGSMETAISAIRAGAYDYLHKPCEPTDLLTCVTGAVQKRKDERLKAETVQAIQQLAESIQSKQPSSQAPSMPHQDVTHSEDTVAETPPRFIQIGLLCIDTVRHSVLYHGQPVHLTPTEYDLLLCLAKAKGHTLAYEAITQFTHNCETGRNEAHILLKPHIHKLRHKIKSDYFVNVRGFGYRLEDAE